MAGAERGARNGHISRFRVTQIFFCSFLPQLMFLWCSRSISEVIYITHNARFLSLLRKMELAHLSWQLPRNYKEQSDCYISVLTVFVVVYAEAVPNPKAT